MSMFPPVFAAVNVPSVQALLKTGAGPLRFYRYGRAPQGVAYPYAVWRRSGGSPENYLGDTPDIDEYTVRIDVYSSPSQGPDLADRVAEAIRDAIEPVAYITAWIGDSTDPTTNSNTCTFISDWLTPR